MHAPYTCIVVFGISVISKDVVECNLLQYPHVVNKSNICEISRYKRELVIIIYELIYIVDRACIYRLGQTNFERWL